MDNPNTAAATALAIVRDMPVPSNGAAPAFICPAKDCPPPLTLAELRTLVDTAKTDPKPLVDRINVVFSDPESLALSFRAAHATTVEDLATLTHDDAAQLQEAYALIASVSNVPTGSLDSVLIAAMRIGIKMAGSVVWYATMTFVATNATAQDQVNWQHRAQRTGRALVMMLFNDNVLDGDWSTLLVPLCQQLYGCPRVSPVRGAASRLFVPAMSPAQLRRVALALQNAITAELQKPYMRGEALYENEQDMCVMALVQVLDAVHTAHETLRQRAVENNSSDEAFLTRSEWYNEVLVSALDVKEDYFRWQGLNGRGGFSYCQCAFLLTPEYKALVVKVECLIVQAMHRQHDLFAALLHVDLPESYLLLDVSREHLLADSLAQLDGRATDEYKRELRIVFDGEDGLDYGGPKKEWFQLLTHDLFREDYGMFRRNPVAQTYWFANASDSLQDFRLVGMLFGLALYNGVILDVQFPAVLYRFLKAAAAPPSAQKAAQQRSAPVCAVTLADLADVDPVLHSGLRTLLASDGDIESEFGLAFDAMTVDFGEAHVHELVAGGSRVPVTAQNRGDYVARMVRWVLWDSVQRPLACFLDGFYVVCSARSPALGIVSAEELELLICGERVLDWAALEAGARYDNGYSAAHPLIRAFWAYFRTLPEAAKKDFLRFCTGSDRCPVGGLGNVGLVIVRHGDTTHLPTASTCFGHFFLPEYADPEEMKRKVSQAIQYSTGFGLI